MEFGLDEPEAKTRLHRWTFGGAGIAMLLSLPSFFGRIGSDGIFFSLLGLVVSCAFGALLGYFGLSFSLMFRLLKGSFRQGPRSIKQLGARARLKDFMAQYDPDFSFEYFAGKVQALLKILIFSEDRNGLAAYDGEQQLDDAGFGQIVDAQYGGAITLNGSRMDGEYCHLDLNVYMTDVYFQNGRIYQKDDLFRVKLCKNVSRPTNGGFSIRKVTCKSCGASFDALAQSHCPYCRTKYSLKEDDWVVTDISRR